MVHNHAPKQAQWLVDNVGLLWQSSAWARSAITSYKSCSKHSFILPNAQSTTFKTVWERALKKLTCSQITTQLYNSYK
jgi:hypothetical protein